MGNAILDIVSMSKSYPGARALDNVSLTIDAGEVHCLVGENGAGKSTLVKILAGAIGWDSGKLQIDGHDTPHLDPLSSLRHGIGTVFQESSLVGSLSTVDNIFLGRNRHTRLGVIDRKAEGDAVSELLERLNIEVDTRAPTRDLSIAHRQMIEIAKLVSLNARVFILDEPTSALDERDVETLIQLVRRLRADGKSIVFISHKIDEVKSIGDRISVLRDGQLVGTYANRDVDSDRIISLMSGKTAGSRLEAAPEALRALEGREIVFRVSNLSDGALLKDISFEARRGEVVAFTGLVGAGKTELAEAIFGFRRTVAGTIEIDGKAVSLRSPSAAMRAGIGLVTDDRKQKGLVLPMALNQNITLSSLPLVSRFGVLDTRRERGICRDYAGKLRIKHSSLSEAALNLSGGNQQKIVLAKWLMRGSRILIFDEPTRGIDVATKQEIYKLIEQLSEQGITLLVFSSEVEEVLRVAHRIFVLRNGGIVKEFTGIRRTESRSWSPHSSESSRKGTAMDQAATKNVREPSSTSAFSLFTRRHRQELNLVIFLVVLTIFFSFMTRGTFFTVANAYTILRQVSFIGFLGIGQTLVVLVGGIDLSIGVLTGLSGILVTLALSSGFSVPVAILGVFAVGVVLGLINGLLITKVRMPDFMATLSTMSVGQGLIFILTGGYSVYTGVTQAFTTIGQGTLYYIPLPVIYLVIIYAFAIFILTRTSFGRKIYAVGGNKVSAFLSGIKVNRVRTVVYLISGALSAFTGIVLAARIGSGQVQAGIPYLFPVLTGVVLGGVSLAGGEGTLVGTLLGVIVMGIINSGMTQIGISTEWQNVAMGIILIAAIGISELRKSRDTV